MNEKILEFCKKKVDMDYFELFKENEPIKLRERYSISVDGYIVNILIANEKDIIYKAIKDKNGIPIKDENYQKYKDYIASERDKKSQERENMKNSVFGSRAKNSRNKREIEQNDRNEFDEFWFCQIFVGKIYIFMYNIFPFFFK